MSARFYFVWYNMLIKIFAGKYNCVMLKKRCDIIYEQVKVLILTVCFLNVIVRAGGYFFLQPERYLKQDFPGYSATQLSTVQNTENVDIEKGNIIGYIDLYDSYAAVSADGKIVHIYSGMVPDDIPLFTGIMARSVIQGEPLDIENEAKIDSCVVVLSAVLTADQMDSEKTGFWLMKQVVEVRYISERVQLMTILLPSEQRSLTVRLSGLGQIQEDMRWLRYAVEQNLFTDAKSGILEISEGHYNFLRI